MIDLPTEIWVMIFDLIELPRCTLCRDQNAAVRDATSELDAGRTSSAQTLLPYERMMWSAMHRYYNVSRSICEAAQLAELTDRWLEAVDRPLIKLPDEFCRVSGYGSPKIRKRRSLLWPGLELDNLVHGSTRLQYVAIEMYGDLQDPLHGVPQCTSEQQNGPRDPDTLCCRKGLALVKAAMVASKNRLIASVGQSKLFIIASHVDLIVGDWHTELQHVAEEVTEEMKKAIEDEWRAVGIEDLDNGLVRVFS